MLWWTDAIIAVIILIPFAWYMIWYRGKTIVIETDGVRLANKVLIPWDGLIDADTWTSRGTTLVKVSVTPRFMQEYQSRQSWGSRLLIKTNSTLGGGEALFFPQVVQVDPDVLALWLSTLIARHQGATSSNWSTMSGQHS